MLPESPEAFAGPAALSRIVWASCSVMIGSLCVTEKVTWSIGCYPLRPKIRRFISQKGKIVTPVDLGARKRLLDYLFTGGNPAATVVTFSPSHDAILSSRTDEWPSLRELILIPQTNERLEVSALGMAWSC